MTISENTIKGKWLEMKGDIQKSWGKLTNNELDKTKGDLKAIGGLIQQRYGEAQNTYSKKLSLPMHLRQPHSEIIEVFTSNLRHV